MLSVQLRYISFPKKKQKTQIKLKLDLLLPMETLSLLLYCTLSVKVPEPLILQ